MKDYKKLMSLNPSVLATFVNSLGQKIKLVEHPIYGDGSPVLVVCDELQLSASSDFFECTDMMADHKEYEPSFQEGKLYIGSMASY